MSVRKLFGKIFTNLSALSALQILNLVTPLVLTPFLIRKFGMDEYGRYAVAFAATVFLQIFLDWGFNTIGVKRIVKFNADGLQTDISDLFYRSLVLKSGFYAASITMLGIIAYILNQISLYHLFLVMSLGIYGISLVPTWLYQGLGSMGTIMLHIIAIRGISLAIALALSIYIADIAMFCLVLAIGLAVGSLVVLLREFKIRKFHPSALHLDKLTNEISEGWHIFVANINTVFFMNLNPFVISAIHGKATVGYYAAAEKIVGAGLSFSSVLFNTAYPVVCQNLTKPGLVRKKFLLSFGFLSGLMFVVAGIVLLSGGHLLAKFLTGKEDPETAKLIKLMSFAPLLAVMNMPAYMSLLAGGQNRSTGQIFIITSLSSIFIAPALIFWWGLEGAVLSTYIVYFILLVLLYAKFLRMKVDSVSFTPEI